MHTKHKAGNRQQSEVEEKERQGCKLSYKATGGEGKTQAIGLSAPGVNMLV